MTPGLAQGDPMVDLDDYHLASTSMARPLSLARPPLPQLDDRELACIFLSLQGIDLAHMCVMVCMCDLALMCVSAHLCDLACMCVLPWSLQGMGRTLARCWPGNILA